MIQRYVELKKPRAKKMRDSMVVHHAVDVDSIVRLPGQEWKVDTARCVQPRYRVRHTATVS